MHLEPCVFVGAPGSSSLRGSRAVRPSFTRHVQVSPRTEISEVRTPIRSGIEQALGNLLENALVHGGGTIRLEAEAENGTVALRVSDEGTGFPPQLLPVAFERFSRTDEARARGSTGLGLAIVDAIARAHGGHASAANQPGGGAEITISLPH